MKIVILEDESLVAERLAKLCLKIREDTEILTIISSVSDAIEWFNDNEEPDLIFSDIQLEDGLSFDFFEEINPSCNVIFTTSFNEYAIDAFKVNSVDYILKPISEKKLRKSLAKYTQMIEKKDNNKLIEILQQMKGDADYKKRFLVKIGQKFKSIPIQEIAYFYIENKLTHIITHNGLKAFIDHSLDDIENNIDRSMFFRINRQMIVSFDSINEIRPYFNSRLLLTLNPEYNKGDILVSRYKVSDFKNWLDR